MKKTSFLCFMILFILPGLCFSVTQQLWQKSSSTPILTPSVAWEGAAVFEPRVLKLSANSWFMEYSASDNASSNAIGTATSTDGVTWTKNGSNPIIGNGNGGEATAARGFLYVENSKIYLFYSDATGGGNIYRQESSDNGATFGSRTLILDKTSGTPTNVDGYANISIIKNGSTYHLMVEAHHTTGTTWRIYHCTSTSLDGPFTYSPSTPLTSLQINGGGYSGPNIHYINGTYYLWYHVAEQGGLLPTQIYFAQASDPAGTWTVTSNSIFPRASEINLSAFSSGIDQSDNVYVYEVDGKSYAYYDRVYNPSLTANCALATFNGTLAQLINQMNTKSFGKNVGLQNVSLN